jgi:hypothetical protein
MFSYRSILKQAWSIVWKFKHLWFFGLFASLAVAGGTMEYEFLTQSVQPGLIDSSYQNLSALAALSDLVQNFFLGIANLFNQNFVVILNTITILLLTATIVFVFVWLAICSQAALIDNVKKIITAKKKVNVASLRDGLTVGNHHFWSVLALNIFIKILISFSYFIISLPLLFMVLSDSQAFVATYTILFVIFVPVSVSLSLIVKYAISARVLENKSVIASFEDAWGLFKKNWLISLEVALILFIISFLASFLLLITLAIVFFPLFWFSLVFSIGWLSFIIVLLALIFIILFGSILTSFQVTTWTDLYLHLRANKGVAKLERIFQRN